MFTQSYCWDFLGMSPMTFVEEAVLQKSCHPSGSYDLSIPIPQCSLILGCRSRVVDLWISAVCILVACAFFPRTVFVCCKVKSLRWGMEAGPKCGCKDKCLECSEELCWFSKVVVIGSSPRSMTSLAVRSWLGFRYQAQFPPVERVLSSIRESCWLLPRYAWHYWTLRVIVSFCSLLWFTDFIAG